MGVVESITLDQLALWAAQKSRDTKRLDMTVPFKRCRIAINTDTKENFAAAKTPDGQAWPPLEHPRPIGGNKPLQNFGLLRASATSAAAKGHVEELSAERLMIATVDERAALHQYGGVVKPVKAKMLSIPLTKEAFRAGGARNFPRKLGLIKSATWGSSNQSAFLVENQEKGKGKRARLETIFHYILVAQVKVPARPFMGFGKRLIDKVVSIIGNWFGERL